MPAASPGKDLSGDKARKTGPFQDYRNYVVRSIRVHPKTGLNKTYFPTPGGLASRQACSAARLGEETIRGGGLPLPLREQGPTVHHHHSPSKKRSCQSAYC